MKLAFLLVLAMGTGGLQPGTGDAEPESRSAAFNPDTFKPLSRLRDPVILRLLRLTDEQRNAIDGIQRRWLAEFDAFRGLPRAQQDGEKLDDALEQFEKEAAECLTDEQQARLFRLTTATYFGVQAFSKIRDKRLQKELDLDATQKKAVEKLYEQWLTEAEGILSHEGNAKKPRARQLMDLQPFNDGWNSKAHDAFQNIFSERQRSRFSEIELQSACKVEGPGVFRDAHVAEKLQLTPEQKRRIDEVVRGLSQGFDSQRLAAQRAGYATCLALLRDAQLERWKAMLGAPYIDRSWLFPDEAY